MLGRRPNNKASNFESSSVSRKEFNELKVEVSTIALETKNNTADIQRLEQEVGKRHKWTTEEVRINEI